MPRLSRVLVFGGSGQLGSEIRRLWTQSRIDAPSHAEADINDPAAVAAVIEAGAPDAVVNCAAFHRVEECESHVQQALAANAIAVSALAEACAERGIPFVTISTDYVFDGTAGRPYAESDAPNPINAYGVSKYAGELLVDRLHAAAYVVRTCGVYGTRVSTTKGYTFIDRIIAQARAGERVRVVDDQIISPTYAAHLAQGLLQLLEADAPYGLYHMVNEGAVSWHGLAVEALHAAGIDHEVEPVSSTAWPSRVRRPEFSALQNAKLHALGMRMPDWRKGVADYVRDRSLAESATPGRSVPERAAGE